MKGDTTGVLSLFFALVGATFALCGGKGPPLGLSIGGGDGRVPPTNVWTRVMRPLSSTLPSSPKGSSFCSRSKTATAGSTVS